LYKLTARARQLLARQLFAAAKPEATSEHGG
jgi:hypothetical protein